MYKGWRAALVSFFVLVVAAGMLVVFAQIGGPPGVTGNAPFSIGNLVGALIGQPTVGGATGVSSAAIYLDGSQFAGATAGDSLVTLLGNSTLFPAGSNKTIYLSNFTAPAFNANPFLNLIIAGNPSNLCGTLVSSVRLTLQTPLVLPKCWNLTFDTLWNNGGSSQGGVVAGGSFPTTYTTGTISTAASSTNNAACGNSPNVRCATFTGAATGWTSSNVVAGETIAACGHLLTGSWGDACGQQKQTAATAAEAGTVVTITTSGGNFGAGYTNASTIMVLGCLEGGYLSKIYNGEFTITGGGSGTTALTYTSTAGGGAATGCTVYSALALGTLAYGQILSVNTGAQTMVVETNNALFATVNAGVNYAIYPPLLAMEMVNQGSSGSKVQGGNYNCNNVSGCVPFENLAVQEQGELHNVQLQNSTNMFLSLQGSNFNFGPVQDLNIASSPSTPAGAIAGVIRTQGASTSGKPRRIQGGTANLDNANSNNGINVVWDLETSAWFGDHHTENGSSTGDVVMIGDNGRSVICPVICVTPPNAAIGITVMEEDSTNGNKNIIHIGPDAAKVLILSVNGSGTNTLIDDNRKCTITANAQDTTLGEYWLGGGSPPVFLGTAGSTANSCGGGMTSRSPMSFIEVAAPSGVAAQAIAYADSTSHKLTWSNNNGTAFAGTQTVGTGTSTSNGTAIAAGTTQNQPTITVTGATTSDVAYCSLNAGAPATWQTGIVFGLPIVTANTVTPQLTNPTAGSITPVAAVIRCTVVK